MKDQITLKDLMTVLRGKGFTGALTFEKGKILFIEGSIKLASYGDESGEFVMDVISPLPLPSGTQVVRLSKSQVNLWLKWQELLHEEEELDISPLPEVDRRSLERFLDESGLAYLLVQSPAEGD